MQIIMSSMIIEIDHILYRQPELSSVGTKSLYLQVPRHFESLQIFNRLISSHFKSCRESSQVILTFPLSSQFKVNLLHLDRSFESMYGCRCISCACAGLKTSNLSIYPSLSLHLHRGITNLTVIPYCDTVCGLVHLKFVNILYN